jgi:hypothetical protein
MLGTAAGSINVYTVPPMKYWTVHESLEASIPFHAVFRPTLASLFATLCGPFSSTSGSSCRLCKGRGVEGQDLWPTTVCM